MNYTKSRVEMMFYIFSILMCIIIVCFLLNMLKYDDCKYAPKTTFSHDNVEVTDYYDTRGMLFIRFDRFPDIDFKTSLNSLIKKDTFEEILKEGKEFRIVYSKNTTRDNVYELISLESDDAILISAESRKKSVTINIIIGLVGISFFGISLIFLLKGFVTKG
ncbi:MAG: hypothetical protein J6I80_04245 [Clostridia bacterium]|nr:hypothetical protein [Clostridia bacterium]